MEPIVHIDQVNKKFGKDGAQALKDFSLDIYPGELFGLIGPDGAGKTTLFRILTTLVVPDSGSARVLGYDVVKDFKEIRKRVGYMPGKFALYPDLSILENLEFYATVFGTTVQENYHRIAPIYRQIEPFKHRRAGALSGGMKQKLALCCALVHHPEILFLDEPTTGVDPVSRKEFWEILQGFKAQGLTIVVSTPYMDEVNQCERIALLQNGQILDKGAPEEIIRRNQLEIYALQTNQPYALLEWLQSKPWVSSVYPFGESLHLQLQTGLTETALVDYLKTYQQPVRIKPVKPGIEDTFIHLLQTPFTA